MIEYIIIGHIFFVFLVTCKSSTSVIFHNPRKTLYLNLVVKYAFPHLTNWLTDVVDSSFLSHLLVLNAVYVMKMCLYLRRCAEHTQSDYVEFSNFNHIDLRDPKMGRGCGNMIYNYFSTRYVNSDGNFFRVTFKSNEFYDATGFTAFYRFRKYVGR